MKFKIHANAEIDTLTKGELSEGLDAFHASWFQEMARGLKPMRIPPILAPVVGGAITAPTPGSGGEFGPNAGFVWAIQRITVFGLATGDTVQVHRNDVDGKAFLGQVSAAIPWLHIGSAGMILKDGDRLAFTAAGLMAAGPLVINGEYKEAPESMVWKLL